MQSRLYVEISSNTVIFLVLNFCTGIYSQGVVCLALKLNVILAPRIASLSGAVVHSTDNYNIVQLVYFCNAIVPLL